MKRQKTTNKHISAVFAQRVVSAPVSFFVSSAEQPNRDNKTPPLPDGPVYPTVTRRRPTRERIRQRGLILVRIRVQSPLLAAVPVSSWHLD